MSSMKFLNIDLDIYASAGLSELLKFLGNSVVKLEREDKNCISVELAEQPESVDDAILGFYDLISSFTSKEHGIWDQCERRSMSIGVQIDKNSHSESVCISEKSISLLASMKVDVSVEVYGMDIYDAKK